MSDDLERAIRDAARQIEMAVPVKLSETNDDAWRDRLVDVLCRWPPFREAISSLLHHACDPDEPCKECESALDAITGRAGKETK